ncbi:MAG: NADH-quinone oxidoreductase subunit D [Elusimicrobia bacterium]|nr:NADH-quinone oxidoreductase subunit D [Elusimicrobiota bacterium]
MSKENILPRDSRFPSGEARETSDDRTALMLNMGPSHPAMHGVIRLLLELDGERIKSSEVEIGYLHRAFEKHAEAEPWNNVVPWTDRLNYVSPLINNVAYCLAVEKLAGVTVPERGQYLRVVASEVSRVTDHLTCVAASAMELGAFTVFLYLVKAREYLYQLVDDLAGARVTTSYARVGGVKADLPPGFEAKCRAAFAIVRESIRDSDKLLTKNRIFMDRVEGTGVISPEDAVAYGITGPFLRSTGVPYDVRRAHPYLVYDRLDFEIPVGSKGDNFDRYLLRLAETEQSMRIVEQCFKLMPEGRHSLGPKDMLDASEMQDLGKAGRISEIAGKTARTCQTLEGVDCKEEVYGSIEGLMNQFEGVMWTWGLKVPAGDVYVPVEGANGELGFFVVSDGGSRPYRVRCRPPCLFTMAALPRMIDGGWVADIIATFGSVNMIAGELDR